MVYRTARKGSVEATVNLPKLRGVWREKSKDESL
jgi:hypothetical protein